MATEPTPLEPDLREPRRRSRDLSTLLWLGGWGGAAAIALTAFAIASQTKTAGERLRRVFAINEPAAIAQMPPRVTQLESDVQLLSAQVRALTIERDRLAGRMTLLESSLDDMTGAIKKQAAFVDEEQASSSFGRRQTLLNHRCGQQAADAAASRAGTKHRDPMLDKRHTGDMDCAEQRTKDSGRSALDVIIKGAQPTAIALE